MIKLYIKHYQTIYQMCHDLHGTSLNSGVGPVGPSGGCIYSWDFRGPRFFVDVSGWRFHILQGWATTGPDLGSLTAVVLAVWWVGSRGTTKRTPRKHRRHRRHRAPWLSDLGLDFQVFSPNVWVVNSRKALVPCARLWNLKWKQCDEGIMGWQWGNTAAFARKRSFSPRKPSRFFRRSFCLAPACTCFVYPCFADPVSSCVKWHGCGQLRHGDQFDQFRCSR